MARGRGKSKKISQPEKLLLVLLDGHEAPMAELEALLGAQLVWARLPTYCWVLRQPDIGAIIRRNKVEKRIVSYQLENHEAMTLYARDRGLIAPLPVVLTPEDLMVAAG